MRHLLYTCTLWAVVSLTQTAVADEDEKTPSAQSIVMEHVNESFTGIDCPMKAPQRLRITDEQAWRRVWLAHIGKRVIRESRPLPDVDFTRHMVIGLVEKAELFPNGIEIARMSIDRVAARGQQMIEIVTVDYHSPGKTERFESGAQKNVFGFFVIPRFEPQVKLRRRTETGWKEVARFHTLPPHADVKTANLPSKDAHPVPPVETNDLVPSRSLNIGFAFDPGPGRYDGVIGSSHDVWNFVSLGTTAIDYMRHANASSSPVRLRVTRHDGQWAVKTDNQVFRSYIYHNCRCVDLEATLLDVAPGRYRAFIYAHGDAPDQNANIELIVGDKSIGKKATSKENNWDFRSAQLREGVQYVAFDFEVASESPVRIISHRDGSSYSMFNAIQLVPMK